MIGILVYLEGCSFSQEEIDDPQKTAAIQVRRGQRSKSTFHLLSPSLALSIYRLASAVAIAHPFMDCDGLLNIRYGEHIDMDLAFKQAVERVQFSTRSGPAIEEIRYAADFLSHANPTHIEAYNKQLVEEQGQTVKAVMEGSEFGSRAFTPILARPSGSEDSGVSAPEPVARISSPIAFDILLPFKNPLIKMVNSFDLFLQLYRDPFVKMISGIQIFQAAKAQAANPFWFPKDARSSRAGSGIISTTS